MAFKHIPVLFEESISAIRPHDGGIYVDGTLGGGGHAYGILSRCAGCRLIGIDRDSEAIAAASERLRGFGERFTAVHGNFSEIVSILDNLGIDKISGALLDLGVSSYQLDNAERGFSYMRDAVLDMRMDNKTGKSAYDVVNSYTAEELTRIFYEYGEEKWSKRIAEFIVRVRSEGGIRTTLELADVIKAAVPKGARAEGGHPAKRVFQAIRIEVNNELGILEGAVKDFVSGLETGGRLAVITFHSLEDRIVKNTLRELEKGCVCPKEFPVCVCGKSPEVRVITKKPILPHKKETRENPRSKSAKLRAAEKV